MLFMTLNKLKMSKGLTEDLKTKIDVFYALCRLTEKEYSELMDIPYDEPGEDTTEETDAE